MRKRRVVRREVIPVQELSGERLQRLNSHNVADALRAPSTDPELMTTRTSALSMTDDIAECSMPVPQSVSTRR